MELTEKLEEKKISSFPFKIFHDCIESFYLFSASPS